MGDDNKDKKPIPVGPGERTTPIRLGTNSLSKMFGSVNSPKTDAVDQLRSIKAMSGHNDGAYFGRTITGAEADTALARAAGASDVGKFSESYRAGAIFARGMTVYDTVRCKKATIVKLNVGTTKKGRPIHKLVSAGGQAWEQRESKLEKL